MKRGEEGGVERPHIGNHFMVSTLKKYVGGEKERRIKAAFEI